MLRPFLKQPRRVVITLDVVGGIWRYALDLAHGLDRQGIACLLVGFGPAPQSANEDIGLVHGKLIWIDAPLDWMAPDESALLAGAAVLDRLAEEWQADLMHLNLPSQASLTRLTLPIVVAAHSCLPTWWAAMRGDPLPPEWKWQLGLNRRGFDRADCVCVPSASHADSLMQVYGALGSCRVVANATRIALAENAQEVPKEPFVFAAGRWWDDGKNGATLDAAAANAPWPILMAGSLKGPNGTGMTLAHAKSVGALTADATLALMHRAAIFAAPSRYEPFGLAVLEAAASGAALVLADIPTFRELWDGAALFVPACNAGAYACAIRRLAEAPQLRSKLSARARMRAADFTAARQLDGILAAYVEAAGARSARMIEAA